MAFQEFLKDLDSLVSAFEKETTASGQRTILAKIQLGLIAAQDIGDDKLVTVQAMSDLIENKARQLEHDSKNLDFGRDDDDDAGIGVAPPIRGVSSVAVAQTSSTSKQSQSAKGGSAKQEKETKESAGGGAGGKPPVKRRKKQATADNPKSSKGDDRDDDAVSTVSSKSGGGRGKTVLILFKNP